MFSGPETIGTAHSCRAPCDRQRTIDHVHDGDATTPPAPFPREPLGSRPDTPAHATNSAARTLDGQVGRRSDGLPRPEVSAVPPTTTLLPGHRGSTLTTRSTLTLLLVLGGLGLLVNLQDGPPLSHIAAAALLASAPLLFLLLCVEVTQSHRPEPRSAKIWALVWGALIATGLSSYANALVGTARDFAAVVVYAPVIEECTKALGLLLLVRYGRIKGALDGVVYALIVGAGFAAVENIYYFLMALDLQLQGGDPDALLSVFLARGIISPFAHPLFTAATGVAIGLSAQRRGTWLTLPGLAIAVLLHALWNYGAVTGHLGRYSLVAVGVFASTIASIMVALGRERAAIRRNRTRLPAAVRDALSRSALRGLRGSTRDAAEIGRREAFRQAVAWRGDLTDTPNDERPTQPPSQPLSQPPWSDPLPWYSRPPEPATRATPLDALSKPPDEIAFPGTDQQR